MTHGRENQQLGAFRLLRHIGSGGMGQVWLAQDTRLLRSVAVKILPRAIAGDPEARARLVREAQIAAQLNHPSVAMVHTIEEDAGCLFVAMEYVEGKPLAKALAARELSDYDVVRIGREIAEALGEAHDLGIVHRDIKPDNVMLTARRAKVLDFGIAKRVGGEEHSSFRTQVGMVIGTVEYMAPEQALGRDVDARTDIFALGVLLYQALAGTLPFSAATATELLLRICSTEPTPLHSLRPDLPSELVAVIERCMEKERENRWQSAHDVATALEKVLPLLSRETRMASPTLVLRSSPEPKIVSSPYAEKRVLIADDDPAIRRLLETLAKRERIDYDSAANGSEAIAALKQREYSMLFLDIMMPRIDGWGVLDYLRTRSRAKLPVVFIITAFLDQTVSTADSEIVTGILYKPVDADDISRLMRETARGTKTTGALLTNTRHRLMAAS